MSRTESTALTIAAASRAIRAGELSCTDVLQKCLAAIDAREEQIHAWVHIDRDAALAAARECDRELSAGAEPGPLCGIPIGIKDIVDVAGVPTCAGAPFRRDAVAAADADVVASLRAAGAIILGKTVTTQFACFDPAVTRNPLDPDRTPGGSSSGSAAAVATGMCQAAIATQTGGSITRPAAYCGVSGYKPSWGLVSAAGVVPVATSLDHVGAIARSITDLQLIHDAVIPPNVEVPDTNDLTSPSATTTPPRIGWLRGWFDGMADESAAAAVTRSIEHWSAAGASVTQLETPAFFDELIERHRLIMAVELAAVHARTYDDHASDYLPAVSTLIEEGRAASAVDYVLSARDFRERLSTTVAGWLQELDMLVCPATTGPPPDRSSTGNPAMNSPWSYAGVPTLSFPVSQSSEELPQSVQLIGARGRDRQLFRHAVWCEAISTDSTGSVR